MLALEALDSHESNYPAEETIYKGTEVHLTSSHSQQGIRHVSKAVLDPADGQLSAG